MKVKNINGTSGNSCKCQSWLKHWEKYSGETADYCAEISCIETAIDGAHVQKTSGGRDWYIIPLCRSHNKVQQELEIGDSTTLVSANVAMTCGKSEAGR